MTEFSFRETEIGLISTNLIYKKLFEICDIQTGPFGSQLHEKDYVLHGTPIITVEHLLNDRINHEGGIPQVSVDDTERLSKRYALKEGDIVFSRVGSVDRSAYVSDLENGWLFSGRLLRVRPDISVVDGRWLDYWLRQEVIKEHVRSIAVGATMPSINTNLLGQIPVFFPKLEEQKQIAEILSLLDEKIELNRKINANLEKMSSALFKKWFVLIVDELPEGWRMGKLSDIAEISSGKRPGDCQDIQSTIFNTPLFGASSIMGYVKDYLYNEPILITGRVGTHGVIQKIDYPCWPSDNTLVVKSNFIEFVFQVMRNIDFSSLNRGSTQPLITQNDLNNVEVIIPDLSSLNKFEKIVSPLTKFIKNNQNENQRLSKIRDSILPRLMRGSIRVDNI